MGLFDFLKHSGNKLFSKDEDAGKKIEQHILADNPGIKNLKVNYKSPTVYLSGEAQSAEALQKAVLMAGNVQGVESVNVDGMKVPAQLSSPQAAESFENVQFYIVQSGDSLS